MAFNQAFTISCCLLTSLVVFNSSYIFHIAITFVLSLNEIDGAYQNSCFTFSSSSLLFASHIHNVTTSRRADQTALISSHVEFFCGAVPDVGRISGGVKIVSTGVIGASDCCGVLCIHAGNKADASCRVGGVGAVIFVHAQNSTCGADGAGLIVAGAGVSGNVICGCCTFVPA